MLKWKLRMLCPFMGYGTKLTAITGVVTAAMAILFFFLFEAPVTGCCFGLVLTLIGWIWWSGRLTAEDRGYMEEAEYPLWMPLTDEDRERLGKRNYLILWWMSIPIIITLFLFFRFPDSKTAPDTEAGWAAFHTIEILLYLVIIVGVFLGWLNSKQWKQLDDTACVAEFPIRHRYSIVDRDKYGEAVYNYMVFYTPDGKFVLQQNGSHCDRVRIIRFRGMVTYLEVDDRPWAVKLR